MDKILAKGGIAMSVLWLAKGCHCSKDEHKEFKRSLASADYFDDREQTRRDLEAMALLSPQLKDLLDAEEAARGAGMRLEPAVIA